MKIFGLEPSPADIDRIAKLATEALAVGAPGDERTWLDAVRKVQPSFDWSRHPRVTDGYKSWLNQTWMAAFCQRLEENNRLWEHARFLRLARYSRLVYEEKKEDLEAILNGELLRKEIDQYKIFAHERWQLRGLGYVCQGHGYLVFRGTKNLPNWRLNLKYSERGAGVHGGFLLAWECLEDQVRQWLDGLPSKPDRLTLTGHSLGGAIAILAADSLRTNHEIGDVITFGSPRLAKPTFAEAYAKKGLAKSMRRYIHETDVVPRLVPDWMYEQVSDEFFITKGGAISSVLSVITIYN